MESVLAEAAASIGLQFSHITTLGTKRYPGNRHWHLKQHPREKGCLDLTYWPGGRLMWITIRNYEPAWSTKPVNCSGQPWSLTSRAEHRRRSRSEWRSAVSRRLGQP